MLRMNSDTPSGAHTKTYSFSLKNKGIIQTQFLPSDPGFDRTTYSDPEYIDLLKSEINEMRSLISEQLKTIQVLKQAKLDGDVDEKANISEFSDIQICDIPQRSSRRENDNTRTSPFATTGLRISSDSKHNVVSDKNRKSIASITSNGPIDISGGTLLSPSLKNALNTTSLSLLSDNLLWEDDHRKSDISISIKALNVTKDAEPHYNNKNRTANCDSSPSFLRSDPQATNEVPPESISVEVSPALDSPQSRPTLFQSTPVNLKLTLRSNFAYSRPISSNSNLRTIENESQTELPSSVSILGSEDINADSNYLCSLWDDPSQDVTVKKKNSKMEPSFCASAESSITDIDHSRSQEIICTDHVDGSMLKSYEHKTFELSDQSAMDAIAMSSLAISSSQRNEEDDVSLFIKPKDFSTIRIKVASTITVNSKKVDDYNCTISINDRDSNKEMWRVRKTYNQIMSLDADIRPYIEFFGLPPIPEKSFFCSATPAKVVLRGQALQNYFDSIFLMPHTPQIILFRICQYISMDFVNPLDDYRSGAKKEGFLIRRYKGLGASWKVRWCQVDGPSLEIYDLPGGSLIEQILLSGSQIGKQSSNIVAEDRGYRHAFLVIESSKSLKLSGLSPKHFFCAESDSERDSWIEAMVEFTDNSSIVTEDTPAMGNQYLQSEQKLLNCEPEDVLLDRALARSHFPTETCDLSFPFPSADENGHASIDGAATKQIRKAKIRQLFPFRSKQILAEDSLIPCPSAIAPEKEVSAKRNMQNYLNKLDLSEELTKAIFGRDLLYALNLSSQKYEGVMIPSICFRCLDYLTKTGAIFEEGIFRMSGSASTIRLLKEEFNTQFDVDLFEVPLNPDIHTVSGLLKTYLRELPSPLFGDAAYRELQNIVTQHNTQARQSQISLLIKAFLRDEANINKTNYDFCVVIFGFLRSVIKNSSRNKMTLKNICIVFVPTFNISIDILSLCLVDYDCIFGQLAPVPDSEREILDLHIPSF